MANRHALLIGVPRYDDDEFNEPRLADAVRSDLYAMRATLEQSGYQVTDCGSGDEERGGATLNRINQSIEEACANAPSGGVLLIYFSGHGIAVNGRDYLMPSDAYRAKSAGATVRGLVPVIPDQDVLAGCRAALVAFFVDACRNEPAAEPAAGEASVEPGGQQPYLADNGQFVLVMGCGTGQVCQYDETGSAFTQALAKVLDPRNPATTLAKVVAEVTADMERRSRQTQGASQEPVVKNRDRLTLAGHFLVCDGDELTDAWRKAVDASPLLPFCPDPDLVREIVAECAGRSRAAVGELRRRTGLTDPWTDQNYPGRVLSAAELLLRQAGLLPEEPPAPHGTAFPWTAFLIAAPFLREAVLAEGIRDAAAIDPANLERTYTPGARGDLELTHEMYQHLVRRATGLRQREATDGGAAADRLTMWLVHQWLAGRVKLWEGPGAAEVYALARPLLKGCQGTAGDGEVPRLVQALLQAIGAQPADERLLAKLKVAYVDAGWRTVAAVLWLAGIMAADPRRLPPVVPDLVGTGMELPLADVQDAAGRRAEWAWAEDGAVDLRLVCEHPALHDAFEDIVARAGKAAETIRDEKSGLGLPEAARDKLPGKFTAKELRPATRQDDEPAYTVPLSRFQIAEEKVRELLMGRQLYGDPALAIRELYQNALDACRWRATRQEYLIGKGLRPAPWAGLIRFTQGTDEDGRPYVECEDNGVGMDLNTLKHVFANAGERFVYGQDFRAEQADWAELDPPLKMVSNSQFGVGVFSYFMLADEITVTTRRQSRTGVPGPEAYEVRIASSGSLFQIRPALGLPGAGTSVRLYLGGEASEISVLRTLRDLLWVAEHRVEVTAPDGTETWEPGELRYRLRQPSPDAPFAAFSWDRAERAPGPVRPLRCEPDLWWVPDPGEGGLVADGISTGDALAGIVVNLRGEHRPQFTVDRKTLRGWDRAWAEHQVAASLPALMDWPGFTMSWLWELADEDIPLAQLVFEYAVAAGRYLPVGDLHADWHETAQVSLAAVGCLNGDGELLAEERHRDEGWFTPWRCGVWRGIVENPGGCPPMTVAGFPVPDPIDAGFLGDLAGQAWERTWDVQMPADRLLSAARVRRLPDTLLAFELHPTVSVASDPPRTLRQQLRRLRSYAITGLNVSAVRYVPAHYASDRDGGTLPPAAEQVLFSPHGLSRIDTALALIKISSAMNRTLADALRLVRDLRPDNVAARELDLTGIAGRTITGEEGALLADILGGEQERTTASIAPAQLARASVRSGRPIAEVLDLCDSLAPLGLNVARRDAYPRELGGVELQGLRYVSVPGQVLSLTSLVWIGGEAGESVGVVHQSLARLEQRGLLTRPELSGPAEALLTEWGLRLLDSERQGNADETVQCLLLADVSARPGDFRLAGQQTARDLVACLTPARPVTPAQLVYAACDFNTALADAAAIIRAAYPGVRLPVLPPECADLRVPREVAASLLDAEGAISWQVNPKEIVFWTRLTREPLGDFLSRLDPFRRLGAPVPAFDEAVRTALNEVQLDEYDVDMLIAPGVNPRYRHQEENDPHGWLVTALSLVQVAGRLGWTLAHAHWRLARLAPIGLTLEYPADIDFPDEIVYWYDLLVLTTYFDGQPPVISGTIDWACLEKAAEEIFDAKPEDIPAKAAFLRDRLRIYAPLFNLELPEEDAVD